MWKKLGEMFEGDFADTCIRKFLLVSMGGRVERLACTDLGARIPISANGIFLLLTRLGFAASAGIELLTLLRVLALNLVKHTEVFFLWGRLPLRSSSNVVEFQWGRFPFFGKGEWIAVNWEEQPNIFPNQTNTIWIPIDLKSKVWFGNTLGFPTNTTTGFLLAGKNKVWFGNTLGCPCRLTVIHAPFSKLIKVLQDRTCQC